jgi:hypothetical protein
MNASRAELANRFSPDVAQNKSVTGHTASLLGDLSAELHFYRRA